MRFIDAVLDLLVEGACPGCSVPGALCVNCWSAINSGQAGPHPRAGICLPLWAGGDYVSPLPQIISKVKEEHRWDVIGLLARRLALAVAGLADTLGLTEPGMLVPFPSRPSVVRERGLDITAALASQAARILGTVGLPLGIGRLLAHARRVSDQSELSSADRECNLAGSLVRTGGQGSRWVILVDDVVTTGASLREGVRALSASGPAPIGLATVAATILRGRNLEEVCGPDYLFFPGPANVKP